MGRPCAHENAGISSQDGQHELTGLFQADRTDLSDGTDSQQVNTVTFDTLIREQAIARIDFLKVDCEGGEYDIFTDKNRDWIMANVMKIAGEFHLHTPELKQRFRHFRDTYLRDMPTHRVLSIDYVDIRPNLWCDWFLEYYSAIN